MQPRATRAAGFGDDQHRLHGRRPLRQLRGIGREHPAEERLPGEVGADAGDISDHVDSERGQLIRRPDPRAHQDRWAAVHAGAENNVPGMQQLAGPEHHANRPSSR